MLKNSTHKRRRQRQQIEHRLDQRTTYRNREQATTNLPQKEQRRMWLSAIAKIGLLLGVVGILGFLLYVNRTPIIRVKTTNRPIQNVSVYQTSAESIMKSSPVYLTKLSFDYQSFREKMIELHPEIASLTTTFGVLGDQPVVSIDFFDPKTILQSNGKDWLLDSNGLAIAEMSGEGVADRYSGLPRVRDDIGLMVELKSNVLTKKDIIFIDNALKLLDSGGYKVINTTLPISPREINLVLDSQPYYLRLNMDEPVEEQVGTALVALETLSRNGVQPSMYVDVRPGEKVYWR